MLIKTTRFTALFTACEIWFMMRYNCDSNYLHYNYYSLEVIIEYQQIIKELMIHDPANEVTAITIQTFQLIHFQLHL